MTSSGMDPKDPKSQWSLSRSLETENLVIFWEAGFGTDPSKSPSPYTVNLKNLIDISEKTFSFYLDSLKFAIRDSSVLDDYKLMIFLLYSTDWAAYGSGQDDKVGSLFINPAAANIDQVVAHEVGHCFQYITGCDTKGGFRYGLGDNGKGGNGFWEQCAQWMAYKTKPDLFFTSGNFSAYTRNNHKHIFDEGARYDNYFLPEYWTFKRGIFFMGKLWRDARFPEDPVDAYKRINTLSQAQFNLEMYDHAARLTTWDLPSLKVLGANYIDKREQTKMKLMPNGFWQIDSTVCIENYGYNSIKLNVPPTGTKISARLKGIVGDPSFRIKNKAMAGWTFGFVALLKDGQRVYSNSMNAKYINANPDITLEFVCPNNCDKLWLVVTGSPQSHWHHEWDDNPSNDEQWPYQIKFENTDLLMPSYGPLKDITLSYDLQMKPKSTYDPISVSLDVAKIAEAFASTSSDVFATLSNSIKYYAINPDGTKNDQSTANAPGHWFDKLGKVTNWGNNSFVYSELKYQNAIANIGQYPNQCKLGDSITIRQALVFQRTPTESAQVTLVFNIRISDVILNTDQHVNSIICYPNPTKDILYLNRDCSWILYNEFGQQVLTNNSDLVNMSDLASGIYFLKLYNELSPKVIRVLKIRE